MTKAPGESVPESTTMALLHDAQRGRADAIDELLRREQPLLRRWARRRIPAWARGVADTVDIVQDVMLRAFRRLDAIDTRRRDALHAYLRQAIENRLRDEMRLAGRRPPHTPIDSAAPDLQPSPFDSAVDAETARRYQDALGRLRPLDRQLIVGRVELGYSYEQLAAATGRPSAESARLAVRRALLRLAADMNRA